MDLRMFQGDQLSLSGVVRVDSAVMDIDGCTFKFRGIDAAGAEVLNVDGEIDVPEDGSFFVVIPKEATELLTIEDSYLLLTAYLEMLTGDSEPYTPWTGKLKIERKVG